MTVVGLTGRYCAGKNHIAALFSERNFKVIDVDSLGHDALGQVKDELAALFGKGIITAEGSVDRKKLGALVFGHQSALETLERVVHPQMVAECIRLIERFRDQGEATVVINAALLHRMNLDILCDTVCFVEAPWVVRLFRAIRRDGATLKTFLRVEKSQEDIVSSMIRGAKSLHILKNWGRRAFIHRQVDEFCATMGI